MAINVEVYTAEGMASGVLDRPGSLRDALGNDLQLRLDRAAWQPLDDPVPRFAGSVTLATDDILLAVGEEEPSGPVHAAWHHVLLDVGPYRVEGELTTIPGFDPGRSLARPTGDFVLLREIRLSVIGLPEAGVAVGDHALINRYGVERISADLFLGFFFPGAAVEGPTSIRRVA